MPLCIADMEQFATLPVGIMSYYAIIHKMCRQQAGAAVGVEPPQAAERPEAHVEVVLLKFFPG